jgi:hypothetical protein
VPVVCAHTDLGLRSTNEVLVQFSQVRRHGTSFRRLALLGSDGKQRHFIVQTGQHYSAAVGERLLLKPPE